MTVFFWNTINGIDIYVKHVNLPGNIPASVINRVLPDSSGFIWLGTSKGLYRWDGQRIVAYPVSENLLIPNVTALTRDRYGVVWAACADGSIYHVSGQVLQNWKPADTGSFHRINDLLFDNGGKLWWGTNGSGLFFHNGSKIINIGLEDGLPDNYIYTLEKGFFGEIWASTDRGVALCKSWENLLEISYFDKTTGLTDDIVRVVTKDNKGNIWLGFHEGEVCFYNKKLKIFTKITDTSVNRFSRVNDIAIDENGLWIANEKGLRYLSSAKNPKAFEDVQFHGESLPTKIETICTDRFGNLWILDKEGLFVSSAGAFTRIRRKFNFNLISAKAIAKANEKSVWIAENNTISEITGTRTQRYLTGILQTTSTITCLKEDEQGNFWIATFGDGVVVFDPVTKKHRFITEKHGLVNNNVLDISIRGNSIWVATLGGASHLKVNSIWGEQAFGIESYDKEHGLGNNFIYNILQDSKNRVWFGTDGNGLVKFDENGFTFYDEKTGLGDDVVYSIAEDRDGDIWLSTASSALYRFDGNNFQNYTTADGLMSNNILSLACKYGNIFILTESGLDILNKSTGNFLGLNEELGLRKITADLNKVYTGNDFVCFVTEQGIIRINTDLFKNYAVLPGLVIDKVLINLMAVEMATVSQLGHDENKLEFEYNGFWYLAPGKVRYLTRLKGYDPDRQITYDRRSSYANLAPGDYTFEVSAFLGNVPTHLVPEAVSFKILQPVYARWWFIVLMTILVLAILYFMIRAGEKRLKAAEARKKEKLEFEFQTLKNQINPHFLFNSFSTLISMIEEKPEVAVEYTEKLSDFFRNILEVKEQELIPMEEELEMMRNYFYIQHKRFGKNFSLEIELDETVKQSKIPPLTLQLLAENAIKHNIVSKNKPLVVKISNDEKYILVKNNLQKKKQTGPSTGIGLQNIKERYRLLTGKEVGIKENEDYFEVILPIIN